MYVKQSFSQKFKCNLKIEIIAWYGWIVCELIFSEN